MLEGFQQLLANMQKNPEKTSIFLDTLGKNIAPNNAFAGIGTQLGQSSLANKARQAQQTDIGAMLAGQPVQTPAASTPSAANSNQPSLMGGDFGMFSPAANPGLTSLTMQAQPDGSVVASPKYTVTPPPTSQPQGQSVNLTDVLPLT